MPAMRYLSFYLERNCVVIPGWGKTKNTRKGCGGWTLWHTQHNIDWLKKNAKVRNGTGGLLIVDVDPKNGGSVASLRQRFPGLPETRTVQTVTQHPDGPGIHLIFTIPADVVLATNRPLGAGIDVPDAVMLPGSVIRGDDGIDRRYTLTNDIEPAPAPLALIAAVDKGQESETATPVDPDNTDGIVAMLVSKFAEAGPGERNAAFNKVALPVLRLAGGAGAEMLRAAYSGDDYSWIDQALSSAGKKAGMPLLPTFRLQSRYVDDVLRWVSEDVRYGLWSYVSDRKVMFAVATMCLAVGRTTTPAASLRDLALQTGLEVKTISTAVRRLIESGRLYVVSTTNEGPREYSPKVGEMTTEVSKGSLPLKGGSVNPLHDVWLCDGLTGRASHVFDLVDVGNDKAFKLVAVGGMGRDAAHNSLRALVDVGLLDKQGTVYSVPADVVEIADRLATQCGGLERRIRLAARISEERALPWGDADGGDGEGGYNDDRRRVEEEDHMRRLGVI